MLYTLFIPVSPLLYVRQIEICASSANQPLITVQFRARKDPQKASSLLGRNHPYSMVSKHNLLRSNSVRVCVQEATVPLRCSGQAQLHLLRSAESLNWNSRDPGLFWDFFWYSFELFFRCSLDQTCCQQYLTCAHLPPQQAHMSVCTHTSMPQHHLLQTSLISVELRTTTAKLTRLMLICPSNTILPLCDFLLAQQKLSREAAYLRECKRCTLFVCCQVWFLCCILFARRGTVINPSQHSHRAYRFAICCHTGVSGAPHHP